MLFTVAKLHFLFELNKFFVKNVSLCGGSWISSKNALSHCDILIQSLIISTTVFMPFSFSPAVRFITSLYRLRLTAA